MFEWEAQDLKPGDEFTLDQGESWHVILNVRHVEGDPLPVKLTTLNDGVIQLGWTRKVIAR